MKSNVFQTAILGSLFAVLMIQDDAYCQSVSNFTLETIEGNSYSLSESSDDKVIILTFFTTWCKPCMQEHPHLENFFRKYRKEGLGVIAISADEPGNRSKVRLWKRRYKLTFPVLLDSDSELTRKYNPDLSFPLTLVLGPDRSVRKIYQGYSIGDEKKLERDIKALLGIEEQ